MSIEHIKNIMNEGKKIVATTKQKSRRIGKNGSPNGIEKEKRRKLKSLKKCAY